MDSAITAYLATLQLGEARTSGPLSVFPVFFPSETGPDYLTMSGAFKSGVITITEMSEGGSVPQLKVLNKGDVPVLLLDGEELAGAKQNRVLNTSILVPGKGEVIIPVSCTEAGRWSYTSQHFADSALIMLSSLKEKKLAAVSRGLRSSGLFESNQREIWDKIREVQRSSGTHSPTGAMKDTYEAHRKNLEDYREAFPLESHQRGLLVFLHGRVVGMEVLSRESAYAELHPRLISSYAMDAVLDRQDTAPQASRDQATEFLKLCAGCSEERYKSVGLGWDHRFQGPSVVGSALVEEQIPIHLAFFRSTSSWPGEGEIHLASARHRSGFRIWER